MAKDRVQKKHIKRAIRHAGGQAALARLLGVKQGHVWLWNDRGWIPAEFAIEIERVTDKKVTRSQLRPDLYPD